MEKKNKGGVLPYIAFRGLAAIVNMLPEKAALMVGKTLGGLTYSLSRGLRRRAERNLKRAFAGEKSPEEIDAILKRLYRNLGLSFVEFLRYRKVDQSYIESHIEFQGLEHIEQGLEKGRGVVLLTAHFGNWELMGMALAIKGFTLSVVARPIDNPYVDGFVNRARTCHGNSIIEKKNALRRLIQVLKNNGIAAVLLDQRASMSEGVRVDFFNIPAPTHKGIAGVVRRTGSVVVPAFIHRIDTSKHRIVCKPPVEIKVTDDRESDILENTRRFTLVIEQAIREHPEEWFWFHSRWERRKKNG